MTRYGMVIDTKKCIGCHVCAMACKTENNLPNDVWWNRIFTDNGGEMGFDMVGGSYPDNLQFGYIPVACQHCENPACVKVCPVGATYKDPGDGRGAPGLRQVHRLPHVHDVLAPTTACALSTGRSRVFHMDYAMGSKDVPEHQKHVVEKCTFCYHRTSQGH